MIEIRQPQVRGIYLLPNLLTVGAMFSGFYAIVVAMKGCYKLAGISIFIAMIMDMLDGRIARLLRAQSEFGVQLDSLSDLLSFGIAPALVMYSWSLMVIGKPGWLVAFIYVVCTALRLARFNVRVKKIDKRYFQGLPTPPAAGLVASIIWVCNDSNISGKSIAFPLSVLAIFLGLLKVSTIRYRSFKDFQPHNQIPLLMILGAILMIALVVFNPPNILIIFFSLYVISGLIGALWSSYKQRIDKKGIAISKKNQILK